FPAAHNQKPSDSPICNYFSAGVNQQAGIYLTSGARNFARRFRLVRVLPDWSLTPLPLFALLPSRMLPAKTKAFLDFIQPRLSDA
ncbi:MAG: hypothetical protein AB7E38_20370, partial [Achromobacter sp.]